MSLAQRLDAPSSTSDDILQPLPDVAPMRIVRSALAHLQIHDCEDALSFAVNQAESRAIWAHIHRPLGIVERADELLRECNEILAALSEQLGEE